MSLTLKKDTRASLSVDLQTSVSNIFGKSHTKPIKYQKPKMILLSEQKKLNPVDFTVKTQLRSPHKFLLNDEDKTPIRFDQSQRLLKPLSLQPKSVKNLNLYRKSSPLAKKKDNEFLKISDIINVNSALYNHSTKFNNKSPSPISFLDTRFSPDSRKNYAEETPSFHQKSLEIDLPQFHRRPAAFKSTAASLINNSKSFLKEFTGDELSTRNLNHSVTPNSTKKSIEKLGIILNLARQNKKKDQFELINSSKELSSNNDFAINLTKSNMTKKRKIGHRLIHKQGLKVQGLKNFDSFSKEIVVTSPY